MEQSRSWKANSFPACQEITLILRNPKFHQQISNVPPPVHVLSEIEA